MKDAIVNKVKKKHIRYIIEAALVCIILFGVYKFAFKKPHAPSGPGGGPREVEVSVISINSKEVELDREFPARISAKETSEVRPQVNGVIKEIKFKEGTYVKAGAQLYQIDPSPFIADHVKTTAVLKAAKAKAARYKTLLNSGGISRQEYEDVISALESAKSDEQNARINLGYTKVYAPISGFISTTNFTVGALVGALQQDSLATITNFETMYADIVVPSKDFAEIGRRNNFKVILQINNETITGVLKVAGFTVDQTTDSIKLRAEFKNTGDKLLPGMFLSATIKLPPVKAVLVPQKATMIMPKGMMGVWIVKPDGTASLQMIKTGAIKDDNWIVTSGLKDGDTVVYEGIMKIREGAKVKAVPATNIKS